jgi:nucleotide-binding universal stress UspA family protein
VHEGGDDRWSKILVGTDTSASADRAVQAAAELATKTASTRRRTSRRSIPRHRTAISSSSPKGLILGDVSKIFDEPLLERTRSFFA